jgi:S1-C subfamily serine protease
MLTDFSTELADLIDRASAGVVQVRAAGRAASGVVFDSDLVLTTSAVIGRDEHPEIRLPDGNVVPGAVAGWDPASRLVLVRAAGLSATGMAPGALPRTGNIVVAIGRSWSNVVTASAGIVSIVGGPLRTGRRHQLETVFRISAPLHDGFAGGAVVDVEGKLAGIATAAAIRGLPVVIPAGIAWQAARDMASREHVKRGYVGIAVQAVSVPERQRASGSSETALLVVGIKRGSPADAAGLLVGDVLVALDNRPLTSPDDLMDLLTGDRVGRELPLRVLRGGAPVDVTLTAADRE